MAMVVMATLQRHKCDRQQFAATNLRHPPLHSRLSVYLSLSDLRGIDPALTLVLVLTCPHSSSPTPMKTHHSHWSMVRAVQENIFPPNWTMTI